MRPTKHKWLRGVISTEEHRPGNDIRWCYLTSGDGEDDRGCRLAISTKRRYISVKLPPIVRPCRRKVKATSWDAETISRMGRDWYWDVHRREFGVSLCDAHFSIKYGRQTDSSREDRSWGFFVPWLSSRFVRHDLYGLNGEHWNNVERGKPAATGMRWYEVLERLQKTVPKCTFRFSDFDGEIIEAETYIEEREWRRGTHMFKWLSLFYKPMVRRSLDLKFSKEVGSKKGSWKGGTLGHSIDMRPGELHREAFLRYCGENNLTYICTVD